MSETNRHSGKNQQEEKLAQAIERMMGGDSLDTVLARAGSDANWLQPLLVLAVRVQGMGEAVSVPPAEASLAQFLAEAARIAPSTSVAPARPSWWKRLSDGLRLPSLDMPRLAGTAVSVAVIALVVSGAFLLGSSSVAAAQNILPGQPLYPIKRLGEEMVLWLPQSNESRDARQSEYEQRRRDEVHILLASHLEAPVTFRGMLETVGPSQIVVSGILVDITQDTQIEEPLEIGARLLVVAHTSRSGSLVAKSIRVEQPAQPAIAPSATDTVQPTPTPTTMPSATATPTVTATSSPEPTATTGQTEPAAKPPAPAAVDTREPEPEPTEEPSEAPDEDGNENENVEDGNQNDNGDDASNDNGDENGNDNGDESNDNEDKSGSDNADDSNDSGDGGDDRDDDPDSDYSDDNSGRGSGGDSGDNISDSSEEASSEHSNDNESVRESSGDSGGTENDNAVSVDNDEG